MKCRICGSERAHKVHQAREMMYGTRDVHSYIECGDCGCLQIEHIPVDMGRYYGANYYSFNQPTKSHLRRWLASQRDRYAVLGSGVVGRILNSKSPTSQFDFLQPIQDSITEGTRVLDVGCGAGQLLRSLRSAGMTNVIGVDPFLDSDIEVSGQCLVRKANLGDMVGPFDLIMLHHSFEHMPEQQGTLQAVNSLLSPDGICLVRVPLVSSKAWRQYGVNWVQLDAPRHFYLHTSNSLTLVAERAGFECFDIRYDSGAFQFWGSEQYVRDIPLRDPSSYAINPSNSPFVASEIAQFALEAARLNSINDGDQAAFYLRRKA